MAIRITETDNERTINDLECEIKRIDDGIAEKMAEIN